MRDAPPRRPTLSHRLYVRIYLALLASVVIAATLFGVAHLRYDPLLAGAGLDTFAEVAAQVLPGPEASNDTLQAALSSWHRRTHADLAMYRADGTLLAQAGRPLPPYVVGQSESGWLAGHVPVFSLRLPDGRWLIGRRLQPHQAPVGLIVLLILIALAVAVVAYPVVRRLTRRLERLQGSVDAWGAGQLSTRVAVEGHDEVARLAASFNDAAARIEALVAAQKSLLANASHELRSPLARIRMAVELMQDQASPAMRTELTRNIAELDQLIDEVLLASRLDSAADPGRVDEPCDLTAIAAEECARVGAQLSGQARSLRGDPWLIRRLVRNLLENAVRHGANTPVTVTLADLAAPAVLLTVCDSGPGVPEAERELIFAPFYRRAGASESAGGVGLGLNLVRQIARRHGGDAVCKANGARGCCFEVTLAAPSP